MTNRATIIRMTEEILDIAEAHGIDVSWRRDLWLKTTNREGRSFGGVKRNKPYMSIAMRDISWTMEPSSDKAEKLAKAYNGAAMVRKDKARYAKPLAKLEEGFAWWHEYRSFSKDPEIGDLYGPAEDKLMPLAALLCHELAHVIDYNSGTVRVDGLTWGPSGSVHGNKWKAIYRLLRTSYVATGRYKPEPVVVEFKPKPTKDKRTMDLIGLPLFDLAA